jgi:hypothetical protein
MITEYIFNSLFQILGSVMCVGILYLLCKDVFEDFLRRKKK